MATIDIDKLRNPSLRDFFNDIFTGETTLEGIALQDDATSIPIPKVTSAPVNAVASQGTLTVDAQPTAGDTMTIGTKVYTFVADGTEAVDGDISVGIDLATTQANIVDAINGNDVINTAHPSVTIAAFVTNKAVITARTKGTVGNAIVTTETFTAATNVFDDVVLGTTTLGVDGTVAEAGQTFYKANYIYLAVADNTTADTNWRRISLGSAY